MSAIGGIIALTQPETPIREFVIQIMDKMPYRGRQDMGYMTINGNYVQEFSGADTNRAVRNLSPMPDIRDSPSDAWFAMGHRLGMIYPDFHPKAHQPYSNENKTIWAVLDGEIFNSLELAKQIKAEGIDIETDDQIEILVKGYQLWHERILSRIEGSFSFVLYDRNEDKLFGARDAFGVKPFYYCHDDNFFAFGSELKSLFGLPFISKKMSKSAVYDYLILGQSETNVQSLFRGISELQPGTAFSLLLPKGSIKIWSYFQLSTDSKIDRYSRNKVSTLAHRLRKSLVLNAGNHLSPGYSTAYRFTSDLESLVFPFLLKESIREMRSQERPEPSSIYKGIYASVYDNPDDLEYMNKMSDELGVELLSATCTFRDFSENLLKVCHLQDIPFTNLDVFAQFNMLSKAREIGVNVVVEPIGGPQLFSASDAHFAQFMEDIFVKGQYSLFIDNLLNSPSTVSKKLNLIFLLSRKLLFKSTADDIRETLFKNNQEEFSYIKDPFKDRYAKNLENAVKSMPESLNQLLVNEFGGPMVKEKLRTSDRNSQYFGVEVRLPFASDRNMADSMIKSSSIYKIRSGQTGNLLRKAMRGIFPEPMLKGRELALRTKKENHWLLDAREELKEFITPDLDDFIDSRKVKKDWDQLFLNSNNKRDDFLWRVINLGVWRHVFFN